MRWKAFLRFGLALFGGLVLVWLFGVHSGESLFGTRPERIPVADDAAKPVDEPIAGDIALRHAEIPVRVTDDETGESRLRYRIRIGRTAGGGGRRMPAEDVGIDIYDDTGSRLTAVVHGESAEILFAEAPDPQSGFRGADVRSITLREGVHVDYLGASGKVETTLDTEELELAPDRFRAPGPATIQQPGLHLQGSGLVYDKSTREVRFERDVLVEGTRFAMPGEAPPADTAAETEDGEPKRIRCAGGMVFAPSEEEGDGSQAAPEAEEASSPLAGIAGGRIVFERDVVASQGDREVRCDRLELFLERAPAAADGRPGGLEVEHALAVGSALRPAELSTPQGRVKGELVRLERDPETRGILVSVEGSPKVEDVRFGSDLVRASADRRLLLRPAKAPGDGRTRLLVVLEGGAELASRSDDPSKRFLVRGRSLDLVFVEGEAETPPAGGERQPPSFGVERLEGRGDIVVELARARLTGDSLEAKPLPGGEGTAFAMSLSPNPSVRFERPAQGDRPPARFELSCALGVLDVDPDEEGGPPRLVVLSRGEPVHLDVYEDGTATTSLAAQDRVTAVLSRSPQEDEGGADTQLRELVAEGAVSFSAPARGVTGTAERLVLRPDDAGKFAVDLAGDPATAHVASEKEGAPDREVSAQTIHYDPASGRVEARGSVVAPLGDWTRREAESPQPNGSGGSRLRCDVLVLEPSEDPGGSRLLAEGHVTIEPTSGTGLQAAADRLLWRQETGVAELFGSPARVARGRKGGAGAATLEGPYLLLERESGRLTCPSQGVVIAERPREGGGTLRIHAAGTGPVEAFEDRLVLHEKVVVSFEEDGEEARALFCDLCTVWFADETGPASASGVGRIVAEGWVRLEQVLPKPLRAQGRRLEWRVEDDDEVLVLSGGDPPCWVEGLLGDPKLRDEADRFRISLKTQEVVTDNGRTVLEGRLGGG